MPKAIRENSKLYCECLGGAVSLNEYIEMMKNAGLSNIKTIDFTRDAKKMMNIDTVEQTLDLEDENKVHEVVDFKKRRHRLRIVNWNQKLSVANSNPFLETKLIFSNTFTTYRTSVKK